MVVFSAPRAVEAPGQGDRVAKDEGRDADPNRHGSGEEQRDGHQGRGRHHAGEGPSGRPRPFELVGEMVRLGGAHPERADQPLARIVRDSPLDRPRAEKEEPRQGDHEDPCPHPGRVRLQRPIHGGHCRAEVECREVQVVRERRFVIGGRGEEALGRQPPGRRVTSLVQPALIAKEVVPEPSQRSVEAGLVVQRAYHARPVRVLVESGLERQEVGLHVVGQADRLVTFRDGRVDVVPHRAVERAQHRAPASDLIPLEDPEDRRDLHPDDLYPSLGEGTHVERLLQSLTRRVQDVRQDRRGGGVGVEGGPSPFQRQRPGIGARIDGQAGGRVNVGVRPTPESRDIVERQRTGPQGPTFLRPERGAHHVGVRLHDLAEGLAMRMAEIIGERAETFVLPAGLVLDDPPVIPDEKGRVEGQEPEVITGHELRRHHEGRAVDGAQGVHVDAGVVMQVAQRAETHRPRPENEGTVVALEDREERAQHELEVLGGAHAHVAGVLHALDVEQRPGLTDAHHHAGDPGHGFEELLEGRGVDLPEAEVAGVRPAQPLTEVALEVRSDHGQVGLHVRVHAHGLRLASQCVVEGPVSQVPRSQGSAT